MVGPVAAVESEVFTDFAIVGATQRGVEGFGDLHSFVVSAPGALKMRGGLKQGRVAVRLERWDARPPEPPAEWEDIDEVPFEVMPDAGDQLLAQGFDPPQGDGLDLGDLARARARVHAMGRHRYSYNGQGYPRYKLPPERWLVQLWPDPDGRGAMEGPPRRVAGPLPGELQRPSPLSLLYREWQAGGWARVFGGLVDQLSSIQMTLLRAGGPVGMDEFSGEPDAPLINDEPVASINPGAARRLLRAVADAAGMREVETNGDFREALQRLGLLARLSDGRIVPSPAPPPVWEALSMSESDTEWVQTWAQHDQERYLQGDIEHLVRWGSEGVLIASPVQIAVRLSLSVPDVLVALEAVHRLGKVTLNRAIEGVEWHEPLQMSAVQRPRTDLPTPSWYREE